MQNQNIHDLWSRGKFWEIFGFSNDLFTTLELAKKYSELSRIHRDDPENTRIIQEAFATLNAPMTRQFYSGCRLLMRRLQKEIKISEFTIAESQIWVDLWTWVSERMQEPSEELIDAIKAKYENVSSLVVNVASQSLAWSGGALRPAGLDSIREAKSFSQEIVCEGCGKFDHTLRVSAFPYVISIVIFSFKRFKSGDILS